MNHYHIEALANAHCECGENPFWHAARREVLWEDIPRGRLFRLGVDDLKWEQFYQGAIVGGFTLQADGALLLFGEHTISRLDESGAHKVLYDGVALESGRFNDVIADPQGRVFAGTMGTNGEKNGGLFRIDLDGSATPLWSGTGCSNGMGFSPDTKYFYWTDSTARKIFRFDYDEATGDLTNQQEIISAGENQGVPDGMTVDRDGNIWSAHWDGYGVFHYSPAGKLLDKIEIPAGAVSSVIFGDDDLKTLYVTTAGGEENSDSADGTLYRVRVEVGGAPEFHSRLGL